MAAETFVVSLDGLGRVHAWSNDRLQFEAPSSRALRDAIRAGLRRAPAAAGLLEAVYRSRVDGSVDVENVLIYNVGPGEFARLAQRGLRLERVFGDPPACGPTLPAPRHYHCYRVVDVEAESEHWARGELVCSLTGVVLPRLDAFTKPGDVWAAVRSARGVQVRGDAPGRFALDLLLRTPPGAAAQPAAVLKPLVDGVVAALHVHDGTQRVEVVRRLSAQLGEQPATVERLLHVSDRGILGARRLLWTRGDGLQWNPRDGDCVSCTLHRQEAADATRWSVDVRLSRVREAEGRGPGVEPLGDAP